jgi:photosystem II stability/assembly factor-like uncharacterized protein
MSYLARSAARVAACLVAVLVPVALSLPAIAQTQVTTGNGEIRAFYAPNATTVYAATYGGGLLRSTNAGAAFTKLAMPGNERYFTAIAGNATVIVAGADEGVLRSTDGGTTWTRTGYDMVSAVAVPGTGSTVLVGVPGLGILRSTDAGATFAVVNSPAFDSLDITSIAFHPSNANIVYASALPDGNDAKGGIYQSLNGGATWAAYTAIATTVGATCSNKWVRAVAVSATADVHAAVLRPCDNNGDVFKQTAGSGGFAATTDPFGATSVFVNGTDIWAGSKQLGLRLRTAVGGNIYNYPFAGGGSQFTLLNTGVNAAVVLPGTNVVLQALRGAGIWRSTLGTGSAAPGAWSQVALPGADRVLSAASPAGTATRLVGLRSGGIWRQVNGVGSWIAPRVDNTVTDLSFGVAVNQFASVWSISTSATNASLAYAAAGGPAMFHSNDPRAGIFRWDGTQWHGLGQDVAGATGAPYNNLSENGLAITNAAAMIPFGVSVNPGNDTIVNAGILGPSYGVFYRNGGPTWTSTALSGATAPLQTRTVVTAPSNANVAVALLFDNKPMYSTNGGTSWAQASVSQTGFERIRFFTAAVNPANASQWVAGTNKGVFISGNGGASWTRVTMNGVFQQQVMTGVGYAGTRVFAGDFGGNRYCSANNGATWTQLAGTLPAGVNGIATLNGTVYYLTDGAGMYIETGSC